MKLAIRLIDDIADLDSCRDSWNELAGERVFHRWEWMYAWANEFCRKGQLAIVVIIGESGEWLGIAPWFVTKSVTRGTVVRQIASGAACSDYTSVAVRPGWESPVAQLLFDVITGHSPCEILADADLFELEGHTPNDPVVKNILQLAEASRLECIQDEISGTWVTRLSGTWEEFEHGLSKSFQRKTRKATSRLGRDDVRVDCGRTADEVAALWPDFVALHQMRRNAIGEPGCFTNCTFGKFLCQASLDLADCGLVRLNVARIAGRPFAANLEFANHDTTHVYQSGMDPRQTSLEPGHLIFAHSIRQAIAGGFREFDFLRGDEPYKERWNARRIPLLRTRIVPPRLSAKLRNGLWAAGRNVRNWARTRALPESALPSITESIDQGPVSAHQ